MAENVFFSQHSKSLYQLSLGIFKKKYKMTEEEQECFNRGGNMCCSEKIRTGIFTTKMIPAYCPGEYERDMKLEEEELK